MFSSTVEPPKKRGIFFKVLTVLAVVSLLILLIGGIGAFFYWQSVKKTPQYSLALLVDAARRDDKEKVAQIVDTEAVANAFIPQITDKAVELYGRGLPKDKLARIAGIAAPLIPAIKDRAREELPKLIVEKTKPIEKVPYWMIALGAERGVDIKINGDTATVKSKIPDRPLELTMKREGDLWKIIKVTDEPLARRIAERVGQELIALSSKRTAEEAGKQIGVENMGELLKKVNDIFK